MAGFDITSDNLSELTKLLNYQYVPNVLEYYDNVTYNIRFYMLNHAFQKRFSNSKIFQTNEQIFKIPDEEKIIIAETGVSSSLSIESVTIHTVHAAVNKNPSAASYQIDLRIKEANGCNLINQIAVVSKAVGYESYIIQPFHIDIWFTGYDQATGKPIKILKDGDKELFLTYEVLCAEVKTNVDNNGAEYNFIMVPVPQGSMDKSITTLFKIGEIKPSSNTYGGYVDKIIDLINEKFFDDNPKIRDVYYSSEGELKYLNFGKYIIADNNTYNGLIAKSSKSDTNRIASNNIEIFDIQSAPVEDFIAPQNSDSIKDGYVQYDAIMTFETMLQELCHHCDAVRNYIVRPRYRVEYIQNSPSGIECRKVYVDLIFTKNSYLEYFQKRGLTNNYSIYDDKKYIKEMQLKEMRNLILNGCVRKRYEWQYNGRDTSVLEFNSSLDKLWVANIGIDNVLTVNTALNDNVEEARKLATQQAMKKMYDDEIIGNLKDYTMLKALQLSNQPLSGVRNLASDKRLYLQDIYHCIDRKKIKDKDWNTRIIYEKNDSLANSDDISESSDSSVPSILAKAGYENIHSAGNLVDLEITILGDPFWLDIISDDELYKNPEKANAFDRFYHFAFRVRTVLEMGSNGQWGNPNDVEDCMEFSNIYQIVESTSILEHGKFIQKLKGTLNPAFVHLARMENL